MFNAQDQSKFWRLLTDYESLTQREAVAVRHGDFSSMREAQRLKAAIFPVWHQLGQDLHLNRVNCPELRERLEAISTIEASNLGAMDVQQAATLRRIGELAASRQRLRNVGKNYHATPPRGEMAMGSFTARV